MISLLDISVLIPLVDRKHDDQPAALRWFRTAQETGWATCPITENGVVRIVSGRGYPNPLAFSQALELVQALCRLPGHRFWPDDISLVHGPWIDPKQIRSGQQITDAYLLALAVAHGGKFVTFDQRLDSRSVSGGAEALVVLTR